MNNSVGKTPDSLFCVLFCVQNTPIGELLFKVSATDDDEGDAGAVRYTIDEVSCKLCHLVPFSADVS